MAIINGNRNENKNLYRKKICHIWILASSASENLLNGFGGILSSEDWGSGVYFLSPSLRTAIIAINQLSLTEETLLLRILGKGKTQEHASSEVIAFDSRDPRRSAILRLLTNWKISIEITGQIEAEEELMMALSQAYLEWEQKTEQTGEARLVLRQLMRRIGDVPSSIQIQVNALSLTQLESLGEALLDFSEPADLVNWLNGN